MPNPHVGWLARNQLWNQNAYQLDAYKINYLTHDNIKKASIHPK
jgi:hypothetical protein